MTDGIDILNSRIEKLEAERDRYRELLHKTLNNGYLENDVWLDEEY